jgi:cytochrome c biogenesis protein CcdA
LVQLSDGGVGGFNKKRACTIIASLGISVIAFTLLLKASTFFIDIPEYVWKWISGGIVIFFGLVTLFPSLWEGQLMGKLSAKSNILLGKGNQKKGFWGDVIVGAALGPVFSTCSPTYFIVLATVLPVSPLLGMLYLLAYTIGLCLALFVVSVIGQKIMNKLGVVADPRGWFKRILGSIFIIIGIAIIGGFDKKTQLLLLNAGFFDVTKIEQKLLEKNNVTTQTTSSTTSTTSKSGEKDFAKSGSDTYLTIKKKELKYKKVPELSSIDGYVNTEGKPVTLESLRGKVVLLDVWTYSCINCQRTIPYIRRTQSQKCKLGVEFVGIDLYPAFLIVCANAQN